MVIACWCECSTCSEKNLKNRDSCVQQRTDAQPDKKVIVPWSTIEECKGRQDRHGNAQEYQDSKLDRDGRQHRAELILVVVATSPDIL